MTALLANSATVSIIRGTRKHLNMTDAVTSISVTTSAKLAELPALGKNQVTRGLINRDSNADFNFAVMDTTGNTISALRAYQNDSAKTFLIVTYGSAFCVWGEAIIEEIQVTSQYDDLVSGSVSMSRNGRWGVGKFKRGALRLVRTSTTTSITVRDASGRTVSGNKISLGTTGREYMLAVTRWDPDITETHEGVKIDNVASSDPRVRRGSDPFYVVGTKSGSNSVELAPTTTTGSSWTVANNGTDYIEFIGAIGDPLQ